MTVAVTVLARLTRTLTVAVLPARTANCLEPSLVLPRTSETVPRQTAPVSPAQFTRTDAARLRLTRSVLADLSFALARSAFALAFVVPGDGAAAVGAGAGTASGAGVGVAVGSSTVPPTSTGTLTDPPASTPRCVSVRFMNSVRADSLMPSKPNPV